MANFRIIEEDTLKVGRHWRFRKAAIDKWLETSRQTAHDSEEVG